MPNQSRLTPLSPSFFRAFVRMGRDSVASERASRTPQRFLGRFQPCSNGPNSRRVDEPDRQSFSQKSGLAVPPFWGQPHSPALKSAVAGRLTVVRAFWTASQGASLTTSDDSSLS